jgi:hypothetical protein
MKEETAETHLPASNRELEVRRVGGYSLVMYLAAVVAEDVSDFAWVGGLHDELESVIVRDDIAMYRGRE